MHLIGDIESLQQNRSIGLGLIAILFTDDTFKLAQADAVIVSQFGFVVESFALFKCGPQRLVTHNDGIDYTIGIEGILVLAEDTQLARTHHRALLRLMLGGEDLHKGRLASTIRTGEAITAA